MPPLNFFQRCSYDNLYQAGGDGVDAGVHRTLMVHPALETGVSVLVQIENVTRSCVGRVCQGAWKDLFLSYNKSHFGVYSGRTS